MQSKLTKAHIPTDDTPAHEGSMGVLAGTELRDLNPFLFPSITQITKDLSINNCGGKNPSSLLKEVG